MPARGTLHKMEAKCLLEEVQQNFRYAVAYVTVMGPGLPSDEM